MKNKSLLLLIPFFILTSCSMKDLAISNVYEDDLYYSPEKKPLSVQEIENKIAIYNNNESKDTLTYKQLAQKEIAKNRSKYPDITNNELKDIRISNIDIRKNKSGLTDTIIEVINNGYWINEFHGSNADLERALRIIEQYPNGFGYFGNGSEIAQNLSFSNEWNVFTRDNKYWWFPSSLNINMYSSLQYSNYPGYRQYNRWNNYRYDYDSFDYQYNSMYNWNRRHAYNTYFGGSFFFNSFWNDPFYRNDYNYGYDPYGYYNGYYSNSYYYGYYSGYNNGYHYGNYNSRRNKLIRERGYRYGRSSRDYTKYNSKFNRRFSSLSSGRNVRRSTYARTNRSVTKNYTRRTINYNSSKNSYSRSRYNTSRVRSTKSSYNRSSSSSSSNSSTKRTSTRIRRR